MKVQSIKKFQQGDVIIKTSTLKQGKKLNHLCLQKSDVSNHSHQITRGDAILYSTQDKEKQILVVKSKEAHLTHEEHKPIIIPKGKYLVYNVKEYDPFEEEIRRVRD